MKPEDLKQHAQAVLAAGGRGMTLTLPPGWKRPPGFPRGELLSVNAKGERNVRVLAHRMLEWLAGVAA